MRLVSFFTPSHEAMYREFVAPYEADFDDVIVLKMDQKCPTGSFKQEGWNECMSDKLKTLMIVPEDGVPTLYVDCDVALTPSTARWARDYAAAVVGDDCVAYSDDCVQWCAGVMLYRPSAAISSWWSLVDAMSGIWNLPDQDVIHHLRHQAQSQGGRLPVESLVIPGDRVSNWATVGNRTVWAGEPFSVPRGCVAWHANWTIGVENKTAMLRSAKAQLLP